MSDAIRRIDIAEARALGIIQEANRRFFHPLGLALEVVVDDDGTETLGGIWDYRDDPEGIWYDGDLPDAAEKAANVWVLLSAKKKARAKLFDHGDDTIEPWVQSWHPKKHPKTT